MGKRSASDVNGHSGGPNNKKAKYNNGNHNLRHDHHSTPKQQHSRQQTPDKTPSIEKESPKPEFQLSRELVNGTIITDLMKKKWRIGNPIGKGSFGEIFLASDNISHPVTNENAKYVVKIEPHSNGPLFVEIHCLLNTAKDTEESSLPPGMPAYIASGSHYFKNTRYRFLVLQRFDRDLHSIIKNRKVDPKSVLILAVQILDVLEHLHDKGYCHSDIKAENLMISKCTYHKNQINGGISNNGSAKDHNYDSDDDDDNNEKDDDEEENSDGVNQNHINSDIDSNVNDSDTDFQNLNNKKRVYINKYGRSKSVRSHSSSKNSSLYEESQTTHYLRPTKKINYSQFFGDETSKSSFDDDSTLDEYITRRRYKLNKSRNYNDHSKSEKSNNHQNNINWVTEDRIFLIDFGLASKFIDLNGVHRPFCMDQRRAHDGTLEFTSRDAHMGAHSRRSDLECLGYNLIFWSQGYLPWKENAHQQQHEKVHWMKEYLMTDVREMLKHIYGKSVPKYLGDFMHYVGQLAYHERPNYKKCRKIFEREYAKLGYKTNKMILNVNELIKNSIDVKEEVENNNLFEIKSNKSIMKNLGVILPFRESNSNCVSPKNLRSKSEKSSKKRKKFSWSEIISQDPDQIARERADKEFDREDIVETPIRYQGKPTYAILQIQNRIKFKDRIAEAVNETNGDSIHMKNTTKPVIDILKKRQSSAYLNENDERKKPNQNNNRHSNSVKKSETKLTRPRTKTGLRTVITPTKRGLDYNHSLIQRRAKRAFKPNNDFTIDESSCSSLNSIANSNMSSRKSRVSSSISSSLRGGAGSSSCLNGISDVEESLNDLVTVFNVKKKHRYSSTTTAKSANITSRLNGTNNSKKKRKKKSPKKKKSKTKRRKRLISEEQEDEDVDTDDTSEICSDYECCLNETNGHKIPVATFKKRIKRTRSG